MNLFNSTLVQNGQLGHDCSFPKYFACFQLSPRDLDLALYQKIGLPCFCENFNFSVLFTIKIVRLVARGKIDKNTIPADDSA